LPRYAIRRARREELSRLPAIEDEAGRLFEGVVPLPDEDEDDPDPVEPFARAQAAGLLWVAADAGDAPVAFAMFEELGGALHLEEIDVHPDHMRQGLGARLIDAAAAWARELGYAEITLTTFREVPWNAPYYERLGFRERPEAEWAPALRARVADEASRGLDREPRLVMSRPIGAAEEESA
jgi:GNAT superfamily N-acetyltransferase